VESLRLSFPAQPEQIYLARHAIADFGRDAGLPGERISDLETIVTEACQNATAHAYPDAPGSIEVTADMAEDEVSVVVRDTSDGTRPRPASLSSSRRMGLVLLAALASSVEIHSRQDRGTELRATVPATS
jgi:anti-sigma regulatory factor (Ser/Thr protein kinase)